MEWWRANKHPLRIIIRPLSFEKHGEIQLPHQTQHPPTICRWRRAFLFRCSRSSFQYLWREKGRPRLVPSVGRHSPLPGKEGGVGKESSVNPTSSQHVDHQAHPSLQSKSHGRGVPGVVEVGAAGIGTRYIPTNDPAVWKKTRGNSQQDPNSQNVRRAFVRVT